MTERKGQEVDTTHLGEIWIRTNVSASRRCARRSSGSRWPHEGRRNDTRDSDDGRIASRVIGRPRWVAFSQDDVSEVRRVMRAGKRATAVG